MIDVLYIINPASNSGMGMRAWLEFRTLWHDPIGRKNLAITERPGHAREIAASGDSASILAVVGGDGTVGETISGIMERQGSLPKLAIIPGGRGNDIARNIGIFSVDDGVMALRSGHHRAFDLIRVDCVIDGRKGHCHAFLYGSTGFSSIPMVKSWMKRVLGPRGAYYLSTLKQIIANQSPHMTLQTEEERYSGRYWMVIAGNAEWAGGGQMRLSPGALTDDGELNITIVPSQSKFKMITRLLPKVVAGEHINEPSISYSPGGKIEVQSDPPVDLELDGHLYGTTPATFSIRPRALQIIAPRLPDKKTDG